jgi:hypothetical protein
MGNRAASVAGAGRNAFLLLLVAAWVGVGLLAISGLPWLPAGIALAVLAASWVGRHRSLALRGLVLLALVYPAWRLITPPKSNPTVPDQAAGSPAATVPVIPNGPNDDDAVVRALVSDEETLLVLADQMKGLSAALLNLGLPGSDAAAAKAFAATVTVVDLGPAPDRAVAEQPILEASAWSVADSAQQTTNGVDLWRPLLDEISDFEHARLWLTRGEHPDGDRWRFESAGRFEALARMKSGEWRSLRGTFAVEWERARTVDDGAGPWQITAWKTESMEWNASPKRLFVEALDAALRPPQDPAMLRRSQHYEATVEYYREGMQQMPHPYFAPISVNQKEGIAVADVNGDGFDDIYITVRIGRNMLLINHGDGTFSEEAAKYQLDLPGHTTCAIFADFDNDGDLDVMLGRSLLRTSYLENRDGIFHQYPIPTYMPMAVISMSAADYNADGLLDVYLCTYRPAAPSGSGGGYAKAAQGSDFDWPDEFFSPELAREFRRRVAEHSQLKLTTVLDQLGPPNVLLVNRGGGQFEPAPENETVGLWRNSLQATWCDYNGDGRPDLYVPNDWGLNVLFRNDMPDGFTEVTQEAGLTYYGFSMGATFGDYDNDGREDLYVSNMYSEAGRRMSERIPGLDPLFADSANGNFLYHKQADGSFRQVAGLEPPAMTVKRIGWSWGGCFADFDNDTFLDLYVMSGYFSAPGELASGLDLESNLWRTMVRADERLARDSFRFSREWRRTPPPDNQGPQIDARMVGVERRGDVIRVHSLHDRERNRYFANLRGRAFVDASGITGLDNPADSRGFAVLDYDRDGWLDLALVNANEPLFNLYHNEMPAVGLEGGVIAIRFVGGNHTAAPSTEYACRDGFGARVTVDLGDAQIVREHRCGEGWSSQHSPTMVVGIGNHSRAVSVTVRWPSGLTARSGAIPEGSLLTLYENVDHSPTGTLFTSEPYRVRAVGRTTTKQAGKVFPVSTWDVGRKPAKVRAYITFTTTSPAWTTGLAALKQLKEVLNPEGVEIIAVPVDPADDNQRLGAYASEWQPTARLVNIEPGQRGQVVTAFADALGQEPPVPSTVITDESGHILAAQPGVPDVSTLRQWLPREP